MGLKKDAWTRLFERLMAPFRSQTNNIRSAIETVLEDDQYLTKLAKEIELSQIPPGQHDTRIDLIKQLNRNLAGDLGALYNMLDLKFSDLEKDKITVFKAGQLRDEEKIFLDGRFGQFSRILNQINRTEPSNIVTPCMKIIEKLADLLDEREKVAKSLASLPATRDLPASALAELVAKRIPISDDLINMLLLSLSTIDSFVRRLLAMLESDIKECHRIIRYAEKLPTKDKKLMTLQQDINDILARGGDHAAVVNAARAAIDKVYPGEPLSIKYKPDQGFTINALNHGSISIDLTAVDGYTEEGKKALAWYTFYFKKGGIATEAHISKTCSTKHHAACFRSEKEFSTALSNRMN